MFSVTFGREGLILFPLVTIPATVGEPMTLSENIQGWPPQSQP